MRETEVEKRISGGEPEAGWPPFLFQDAEWTI
jgi:hypothetical protein